MGTLKRLNLYRVSKALCDLGSVASPSLFSFTLPIWFLILQHTGLDIFQLQETCSDFRDFGFAVLSASNFLNPDVHHACLLVSFKSHPP